MKIKVVVVDIEMSRRAKRIAAVIAIPLLVAGAGATAYASLTTPLKTWSKMELLTADDLNAQFANLSGLDSRITALESKSWSGSNTGTMYTTTSGNVGVGTTVPRQKLDVIGDASVSRLVLRANGNGYGVYLYINTASC